MNNDKPYSLTVQLLNSAGELLKGTLEKVDSDAEYYKLVAKLSGGAEETARQMKNIVTEPPDISKGKWHSLDETVAIRKVKKKTLEKYRNEGYMAPDGLSGIDSQEIHWKRDALKGKNAATWYFIPYGD